MLNDHIHAALIRTRERDVRAQIDRPRRASGPAAAQPAPPAGHRHAAHAAEARLTPQRAAGPSAASNDKEGRSKMSRIHLAVAAASVAAAALAPPALARPADVTFGGRTSAKWPIMVQLSRDGRQVAYAVAAWSAQCTDGPFSDQEVFEHIPVSGRRTFSRSYDTGDVQQGSATAHLAASITGKLDKRRSKITGTVRVMQSYKDPSSGVDSTCDTGTVSYVAVN